MEYYFSSLPLAVAYCPESQLGHTSKGMPRTAEEVQSAFNLDQWQKHMEIPFHPGNARKDINNSNPKESKGEKSHSFPSPLQNPLTY